MESIFIFNKCFFMGLFLFMFLKVRKLNMIGLIKIGVIIKFGRYTSGRSWMSIRGMDKVIVLFSGTIGSFMIISLFIRFFLLSISQE